MEFYLFYLSMSKYPTQQCVLIFHPVSHIVIFIKLHLYDKFRISLRIKDK